MADASLPSDDPTIFLCECGCGTEVSPGKRFISGHNNCKTPWKPTPEPQLCECGCGKYTTPGKKFISGHNARIMSNDDRFKRSIKLKGVPRSDATRLKISKSKRGKPISDKQRLSQLKEKIPLPNGWEPKLSDITTNKECSLYLGSISEILLSKIYDDVQVMPNGNHGFDFICNRDKKIDVKSSAIGDKYGYWTFHISKNVIADYFLCIAFNNRESFIPQHVWLIPGNVLSNITSTTISETTLGKWNMYEHPIDKVVTCCDGIKQCGDING